MPAHLVPKQKADVAISLPACSIPWNEWTATERVLHAVQTGRLETKTATPADATKTFVSFVSSLGLSNSALLTAAFLSPCHHTVAVKKKRYHLFVWRASPSSLLRRRGGGASSPD
jgi:hypothetical protein